MLTHTHIRTAASPFAVTLLWLLLLVLKVAPPPVPNPTQQGPGKLLTLYYWGGLHLRGLQNPTAIHQADEPTGGKEARPPDHDPPVWVAELASNSYKGFDLTCACDRYVRPPALWRRIILLCIKNTNACLSLFYIYIYSCVIICV